MTVASYAILMRKLFGIVKDLALRAEFMLVLMWLSQILDYLAHSWTERFVEIQGFFFILFLW